MRLPDSGLGHDFATALPMLVAQSEMRPRERLVWAERAMRGAGLRQTIARMLFGIFFAGFAVFWMVMASAMTTSGARPDGVFRWFPWFGLPFLLIGTGMVAAPLLNLGMPPPIFALSNRRVVVIAGRRGERVRSFDFAGIADIQRIERRDGSGDITFARQGTPMRDGLYGVADVRRTAEQLERLRALAANEPPDTD